MGVAVSGGGDSMALLHITDGWARSIGCRLHIVTVNHGLRDASLKEAEMVAGLASELGWSHDRLDWHWDGSGNLSDRARRGRYTLMTDWARSVGVNVVALGHTRDDVAETFLMRLGREAGVDGLAQMAISRLQHGITWIRPLLNERRDDLRHYLQSHGFHWVEDPTNEDDRFDRARLRKLLPELAAAGVTVDAIAMSAERLKEASHTLNVILQEWLTDHSRFDGAGIILDADAYVALQPELRHRCMAHTLRWIAAADYKPRGEKLNQLDRDLTDDVARTLHGCLIVRQGHEITVSREYAAVAGLVTPTDDIWDNRWRLRGPDAPGLSLRALGESGLSECDGWRDTGIGRAALISGPAVWRGAELVAAPLAGFGRGWRATRTKGRDDYLHSLLWR